MYMEIIYMVSRRWQLTRISTRIQLRTGRCWQIQKDGRETWNVKLEQVSHFATSLKSSRLNFRFASCCTFWALISRIGRGVLIALNGAHREWDVMLFHHSHLRLLLTLPIQQTSPSATKQAVEILRALHLIACFAVLSGNQFAFIWGYVVFWMNCYYDERYTDI